MMRTIAHYVSDYSILERIVPFLVRERRRREERRGAEEERETERGEEEERGEGGREWEREQVV